ncbi:MAG: ABC transporter ATP-binding protein [Deltaproteobacteria bacterium]|nr:ABC transporter ATP-binding protein [Deltaproteobacteria bacterium]
MSDIAVKTIQLGKAYRLYSSHSDKILDSLGINKLLFFRKNYYQEFWALRDISIIVERGERVGIIGRNGAGKSTLLKIIAGNISPTAGKIVVNGKVDALIELGTGFHPEFTGRENIRASLRLRGFSYKEIKRLEDEIIDFAELDEFIDYPVKTYSAGMYARLAFSVSTMLKPDILIIDEILGAGDAYFAGKCIERMKRLTEESGATVLFVSHDISSVQKLCDRAIFLEKGKIVEDGDTVSVTKKYTAMIREMENNRLKLKSLGLMRKDAKIIDTEYGKNVLLFHLIEENWGTIKGCYPFTKIEFIVDTQYYDMIDIGGPMDNDSSCSAFLITSPRYTDWSLPRRINGYMARVVTDCNGVYKHAPFVFRFPEHLIEFDKAILKFSYIDNFVGSLFVELYNGENYIRLGEIKFDNLGGIRNAEFEIGGVLKTLRQKRYNDLNVCSDDKAEIRNHEGQYVIHIKGDVYGDMPSIIENVIILDSDMLERYVFITREKMIIRINYNAPLRIAKPIFVVAIYGADGTVVNQAISSKDNFEIDFIEGRGYVDVIYDPLIIGEGDYYISVGIFKTVDLMSRGDNPAYSVHDRKYLLKIKQPHNLKVPLGIVNQDIKWEMSK